MKHAVLDSRLYGNPRVWQTSDGLLLDAKFMTPSRIVFAYHVFIQPLATLWKLFFVLFLADAVLSYANIWSVVPYVPFGKQTAWTVLGVSWLLWQFETSRNHPMLTALFGRRLKISASAYELTIGAGLSKRRFALDRDLTFRVQSIDLSYDRIYQHSQKVELLIDQTRSIPIAEVFGWDRASCLTMNANTMINMVNPPEDFQA